MGNEILHQFPFFLFSEPVIIVAVSDFVIERGSQGYQQDNEDNSIYHIGCYLLLVVLSMAFTNCNKLS